MNYDILTWLDTIPLSRRIHNIESDFADGILIVEIIAYFFPEYVNFEVFHIARNMSQRTNNWRLLNSNVLSRINLHASGTLVHNIINEDHRSIELFLNHLRKKLEEHAICTGRKSRLKRYHLPQIRVTTRQHALVPGYGSSRARKGKLIELYDDDYHDVLMVKEEEIEILRAKLKRCEKIIHIQDKRIQELEEKFEKLKPK